METYQGHVRTPTDAILLFEACRIGLLPRVQRRLSEKERQQIKSGSVFVWDEREAGMRRWTDGKSWSASRVSGSFLTYREMEGKRGGIHLPPLPTHGPAARKARERSERQSDGSKGDSDEDGPDGYRYKPDGLMKQSFSITTQNGQHLHLISYYARSHPTATNLQQPSQDPSLRHIRPPKNMYPESTVNESTGGVPAVTRGPMPGSPYAQSPHPIAMASPYNRPGATHPQGYGGTWPPTPNGTPPYSYAYYPQGPPPPGQSPLQYSHYPQQVYAHPQGPTVFDRPPPPLSNNGVPPPPPHMMTHPQQHAPHPQQHPQHSQHPQHPQHPQHSHYPPPQHMAPQHHPQYIPNPSPHASHAPPHASQAPQHPHQQPHANGHQIDPRLAATSVSQLPGEPDQGPHLPALNGSVVTNTNGDRVPSPHLSVSRSQNSESLLVPDTSNNVATNAPSPARTIPSVGSLLNTNPPNDASNDGRSQESSSRAGSRSPNSNAQRSAQDISGDRMNARATDQKALRKLDSMLLMR